MVNINEAFPSNYIKSADLRGEMVKVIIDEVKTEEIGSDRKLVMYFKGKEKGMVLNKTNARTIGDVYGDDTDEWLGKEIELFAMKVDFQGRMVDGLRVRVSTRSHRKNSASVAPNARDRAMATADAGPPPRDEPPIDDLDDEIPF